MFILLLMLSVFASFYAPVSVVQATFYNTFINTQEDACYRFLFTYIWGERLDTKLQNFTTNMIILMYYFLNLEIISPNVQC